MHVQGRRSTRLANSYFGCIVTAVMTNKQMLVFMKGKAYVTVFAPGNGLANCTLHVGRETTPVMKEDYLFS
jgi:hypothetical protein